ncbi:MAG: hypothetical protein ACFCVK_06740 [Acidimicrobiales bacterium]
MLFIVGTVSLASCATGNDGAVVDLEATLAGRDVGSSSATDPIALHHEEVTELAVVVTNISDGPVTVAHVRLEGELLDMIFLTYDTGVGETIQPGEQRGLAFPIDFFDLEGQAHGLLRGHVQLFDEQRRPLGGVPVVIDGRGSPFATTAVFNLVLFGAAALGFAWNLKALALRRLPDDATMRGLRFMPGAAAAGLAVSVACSTFRVWPLPTMVWLPLTLVAVAGGFVLGYVSPGSDPPVTIPPPQPVIHLESAPDGGFRAVRLVPATVVAESGAPAPVD